MKQRIALRKNSLGDLLFQLHHDGKVNLIMRDLPKNAPIAKEKSSKWAIIVKKNNTVMDDINNSSGDFAAKLKIGGKMNFPSRKARTASIINLIIVPEMAITVMLFSVARIGRAMKTTKSCIRSIPNAILPCKVSICSESDNNFTTIIVLLNVKTNPIIIASNCEKPKERPT